MDFSNYKFRCSSLGELMTNQQGKKDTTSVAELSETAKAKLVEIYVAEMYGRRKDVTNKYIEKGLAVEEDAITLYSRVEGAFFKKNDTRLVNEFIQGEPDMFVGRDIHHATRIIDTKSSWDIFTFFAVKTKPVNKSYTYQLQGYCALSGAEDATLAYCLVDTPEPLINDEKRRLLYKMSPVTELDPDYQEACEKLERNMKFGDIPMQDRVIKFELKRDRALMQGVYNRVPIWRQFLNNYANDNSNKSIAA